MTDVNIIEKNPNSGIIKGVKKANGPTNFDLEKVEFLLVIFLAKILRERESRNVTA